MFRRNGRSPPSTPLLEEGLGHGEQPTNGSHERSAADDLLQRKERAMQKRQLKQRIVWDIGVWVMLIPIGGGGFIWAIGRLARKW